MWVIKKQNIPKTIDEMESPDIFIGRLNMPKHAYPFQLISGIRRFINDNITIACYDGNRWIFKIDTGTITAEYISKTHYVKKRNVHRNFKLVH